METYELIFQMIKIMLEYISPKEKEAALFSILDLVYDEDICDLNQLKLYADEQEEEWVYKKVSAYIKENGLEEEEEDYYE